MYKVELSSYDILLVSDDNNAVPSCAAAMGARHDSLNLSKGE